jgi:hypothetical protein
MGYSVLPGLTDTFVNPALTLYYSTLTAAPRQRRRRRRQWYMMVQITLMELRRANGGIARAIALHVQQPDQAAAVDGCSGAPRSHTRSMQQ